MATKRKKSKVRTIGRDAGTGKFIPVKEAERRKKTAVVETIKTRTSSRVVSHFKPIHTTSGASGAEIIKSLNIRESDVKAAKKLVIRKQKKTEKTSKKK